MMPLKPGDRVEWDGDLGTVLRVRKSNSATDPGEIVVKMDDGYIEAEPEWQWTFVE